MRTVNEILEQFGKAAGHPEHMMKQYLKDGKKVVLCAPVYTPEEIIHSMGMVPFGAWGADKEIEGAKRYFPAFICSIMQSILDLGIDGTYDGATAIVIPSLCDSLKVLGENWKYAVPTIPFIPMTYPQNRKTEAGREFTKNSYKRVISDLEKYSGEIFSLESLAESIKVYNNHNRVMRKIVDILPDYDFITPKQRSDIFKSSFFMLKEEHTSLVEELMESLENIEEKQNGKIRIITTGILADNSDLLSILEKNNMVIVGDDIANESRQYRVDAANFENALDSLVEKFINMDNCSVLYDKDKKRADYIVNMAREKKADGIIVLMTKFCDPEEFDYVILKKAFEKAGIDFVTIEVDRQMVNYEQANTIIQTFNDMLN
jgi:benzoyl-CoA reductase/2-hydroxyglutaryl-CoA dehydratase subunit BcrC/BadD/HgdB